MSIILLVVVAFTVIGLQRFIYVKYGLSKVTYACRFGEAQTVEGEEVEFIEEIANRKILPVPWIRKESQFPGDLKFVTTSELAVSSGEFYQNHASMFSLLPFMQIKRTHKVLCAKRGWYTIHSANLSCGDLVDLSAVTNEIKLNEQILVFPRPFSLHDLPFSSRSWQGDLAVRRWILADPFSFSGVREYEYGDPLNLIHWKATARTGSLQVHNRDFTADPKLMICINFIVSENMWRAVTDPQLIENGIRYAVTLAQYALKQGLEVGFACNGYLMHDGEQKPIWIWPAGGDGQYYTINETMAKLDMAVSHPFDVLLQQGEAYSGGQLDYIILTPYMDDKIQNQLRKLEGKGHTADVTHISREFFERADDAV